MKISPKYVFKKINILCLHIFENCLKYKDSNLKIGTTEQGWKKSCFSYYNFFTVWNFLPIYVFKCVYYFLNLKY